MVLARLKQALFGNREARRFAAWARERAFHLGLEGWADEDVERLSFLDEVLKDKRIAFLGEPNHFIHEKYDFRLFFLRYLISRGWRCVGAEMGWSDGARVDRFLADGDPSHLERVTIYGYSGAARSDRDDRATGMLKDSWDSYPETSFKAEQIRFAQALRALSESRPAGEDRLRFFGFDIDALPGGGYEDIEETLTHASGDPAAEDLRSRLGRVAGETIELEVERLTGALGFAEAQRRRLEAALGRKPYHGLVQDLGCLRDSFEWVRLAGPAQDYDQLNAAMAAREGVMHRNLLHVLAELNPRDKVVLMGHCLHLTRDSRRIQGFLQGAMPGGKRLPPVGDFVHRLLPGQVFSAWMLYDHGRDAQPYGWLSQELTSVPGSLNAALAKVGPAFVLATDASAPEARLLNQSMRMVHTSNMVCTLSLAEQTDAVYFIRQVSPLRA